MTPSKAAGMLAAGAAGGGGVVVPRSRYVAESIGLADGAALTGWADEQGLSNLTNALRMIYRPGSINGLARIESTGVATDPVGFSDSNYTPSGVPFSLLIILQPVNGDQFQCSVYAGSARMLNMATNLSDASDLIEFNYGPAVLSVSAGAMGYANWHGRHTIIGLRRRTDEATIRVDGVQAAIASPVVPTNPGTITVGGRRSSNNGWRGFLVEARLYDTDLADDEFRAEEEDLAATYALTLL